MKDKEAKIILEDIKNSYEYCHKNNLAKRISIDIDYKTSEAIETILNIVEKQEKRLERQFKLLQKKDKIIKGQECLIETQTHNEEVYEEIFEYKDKMIDLMLDEMAFNHNINSIVDVLTIKKQLKEKFMNKAKEKK